MTVREHIIVVLNKRIKVDKIINQVALAKALNVTESAISKMMKTGQIDLDNILVLCEAIKISPDELIGYKFDPEDRALLDALHSNPNLKAYVKSTIKNQ